ESFKAAKTTIEAVAEGRRYVEQAPVVAARHVVCGMCGAAVLPEDTPQIACRYCRAPVFLDDAVRAQAAAVAVIEKGRDTERVIVSKLLEQRTAANANRWLLAFTLFSLAVWPFGFWLILARVGHGLARVAPLDVLFLAMPLAAVMGGFFLTRSRLADRSAF